MDNIHENNILEKSENDFIEKIKADIRKNVKHNKISIEKIANGFNITNKNLVKEFTELAIVNIAREIAETKLDDYEKYEKIVELYKNQVNLSHRTSQSMLLQQYSTPAPIAFIAGLYVNNENKESLYFEPSAGNGLLTIALPYKNTIVNELDDVRLSNLKSQPYLKITNQDATLPFTEYYKKFDGIVTNPPFGTLMNAVDYDGFSIKTLDHLMALRALDTLKDDGKAAIIIGGHTDWDEQGRIQAGKNRLFFNYLYSHYNVEDVILIDGHKLYSRQGTSFDVRLILIDGRKEKIEGFAPLKNDYSATVIADFDDLWNRVFRKPTSHFAEQVYYRDIEVPENLPIEKWHFTQSELINSEIQDMKLFGDRIYPKWITDNINISVTDNRTGKIYEHFTLIKANEAGLKKYGKKAHFEIVKKALAEGKPVTGKVLKDYPELIKNTENKSLSSIKLKLKIKAKALDLEKIL